LAACSSSGSTAKAEPAAGSTSTTPGAGFDPARYGDLTATLKGSGSTFQQNYDNAAIKLLTSVVPGLRIDYAGGGSGQGKSDLADGTVDFAGTDSLVKPEDASKYSSRLLYFPTVVAPITVSYNLRGLDRLNLDGPVLAGIFSGKVTTWDDPAIAALNPSTTLPSTPVNVCRRSDASGTTTNFSKYLVSAGGPAWTLGSGDAISWPAGTQGADGNGGMAQCIKGKDGSIGYVDLSDAKSQHLTFASVRNRAGEFVQPTLEAASAAAAHAEIADDLTYSPIDTDGAGVYPITSPTWVIVLEHQPDRAKGTGLKAFLEFLLTDGQDKSFTSSVNYAPLPKELARRALARVAEIRVP
jgi:phosphate transport system substrate-binding protein